MKLLIVGSTGTIGRQLVAQALNQGHLVTAFARDPAKLDPAKHPNLRVFRGDVLDPAAVEKAVTGQEAVLCALGAGSKGHVRATGTQNIVRAMEQAGIKRLVCQTSLGIGDSRGNLDFFWKYIMFGLLLRAAFADHEKQEAYVRQSELDWVLVRPAAFTNGKRTGQYRHGFSGTDKTLKLKIARPDVADFMLKQLTDDTYLRQTPGLSY